jgi:hypothetical protein
MGLERDLDLLRDIIDGVSQLVMSINPPINRAAYDLNAAAFNETTGILNDFILDNIELNFTTTAARDITITSEAGTIIFDEKDNIDTSLIIPGENRGYNGGDNITIDITQTGAACSADVILRIRSGSNTLVGNPDVRIVDSAGNVYEDAIRSRCLPTIDIDHFFTHAGATFSSSDTDTVLATTAKDFLIITPANNEVHLINWHFTSTQAASEIVLYEEPTTSADGSLLTLFNKNRNSAKTAEVRIYQDPTVSDDGTQLEHDLIVGGKQSGGGNFNESGEEWVLKKNTKYLIKYNNNSNQDDVMDWKISFLEPAQL